MREGWAEDDYLIIFSDSEVGFATVRYQMDRFLPGYVVVGLKSWDDVIVQDGEGNTYTVPSVPLVAKFLDRYSLQRDVQLEADTQLSGKIKWYVKPIFFGGDPGVGDNLDWVSHVQHGELVVWWNDLYNDTYGRSDA
jgi:hypothetical protein